jgi:HSP20 family protein
MDMKPWDPWRELERMQDEMDAHLRTFLSKLRAGGTGRALGFVPATDVVEYPDEYRVYISLPGIVEEDIDITLEGNQLIVRGESEPPYDRSHVTVHHEHRSYGFFERRVELPEPADRDSVSASSDLGVLSIRVRKKDAPRAEPPGAGSPEGGGET